MKEHIENEKFWNDCISEPESLRHKVAVFIDNTPLLCKFRGKNYFELEDAIVGFIKELVTVKEFSEKIDLYLIELFHQAHDSQKECEQHNGTVWENDWQRKDERMIMIQNDIQPFIRHLAEQYSKEE